MKNSILVAIVCTPIISLAHLPAWSGQQLSIDKFLVADLADDLRKAATQAMSKQQPAAVAPAEKPGNAPQDKTAVNVSSGEKTNAATGRDGSARLPGESVQACRKRLGGGRKNKAVLIKCNPNAGRGKDTGY